jgi:hypothetical protein
MYVIKRDGRREPVHFDKITARITKLSYGLNADFCEPVSGGLISHCSWDFVQTASHGRLALLCRPYAFKRTLGRD